MNRTIINLRSQRSTLWEKTKNFLEEHRGENGLVAAEYVDQYNKMISDVQALGEEIKLLEDQMEMEAQLSAATSAPVQMAPGSQKKAPANPTATAEYSKAFWDNMRGNVSFEVRNALSVGENEAGGYRA